MQKQNPNNSDLTLLLEHYQNARYADAYELAISITKDYPFHSFAWRILGVLHEASGNIAEALLAKKTVVRLNPNEPEAHYSLGITLMEVGDEVSALEEFAQVILIRPTLEAKHLFVSALKNTHPTLWDDQLAGMVISALLEPWGKPQDIEVFACQLLKLEPDFQNLLFEFEGEGNKYAEWFNSLKKNPPYLPLLSALMVSGPISDPRLEKYFTSLRLNFLESVNSTPHYQMSREEEIFYCALAEQCFVNEYVYYQTPEEIDLSIVMRNRLIQVIDDRELASPALMIAVACYFPLYTLKHSDRLLMQNHSKHLMSVLRQQIEYPLEEIKLKSSIPALTDLGGEVTLAVQDQYEENPYPRWVRLPHASNTNYLNFYISKKYPKSNFTPLANEKNLEVLIAGCGTGQHPIICSQVITGANILAVDLSMSSLAYAKRKTIEMGISSIEYAQADILKMASLGREFDVIETVGVLHHLQQPFEGWKALLSVLKPNGLMRVGLYSELGRKDITKIRKLINQEGIRPTPESIRNYRNYLLNLKTVEGIEYVTGGIDFYSMSACRDLIFHVQEHQMQLDLIGQFLEMNQLKFLGLDIDKSSLRAFGLRFPDDPLGLNLKNWHIFENENPHTFRLMYQLLVQKCQ